MMVFSIANSFVRKKVYLLTYLLTYFYFLTKLFFVTIKIHYGLIMKLEIYLEKRDIRTVYNQWKISNRLRAVAID